MRVRAYVRCLTAAGKKAHAREIGRFKTLCGRPVVANEDEIGRVDCRRCLRAIGAV